MRNYIDSFHKESEIYAVYSEQSTAYFEKIVRITIDVYSIIPQEKQNGSEEDCQANIYVKDEANKIIEENASETIKQISRKTIDFKTYLDNMIQESNLLKTTIGKTIIRNLIKGT